MRHCSSDSLISHDKAGWHAHTTYPMKEPYNPLEFYKLKNWYFWNKIDRYHFINDFRKEKTRYGFKYEMHN